jgi:hypothetical protein
MYRSKLRLIDISNYGGFYCGNLVVVYIFTLLSVANSVRVVCRIVEAEAVGPRAHIVASQVITKILASLSTPIDAETGTEGINANTLTLRRSLLPLRSSFWLSWRSRMGF